MVPELAGLLERILLSVHMGNFWSTEIQTLIITLFRNIMLTVPKGARATCAEACIVRDCRSFAESCNVTIQANSFTFQVVIQEQYVIMWI